MNEEENIRESAGQESAVGSPQTEAEQAKEETAGVAAGGSAEEEESRNRSMAAARRSGREEANRAFDAEIAGYGLVNSDGRRITNRQELSAYLKATGESQLSARAKAAGKTPDELKTEEDERRRGREQIEKERAEADRNARVSADLQELKDAYPKINAKELLDDDRFVKFAGSRLGRESLVELYESYTELMSEHRKAEKTEEKAGRSTGSGSGGEGGSTLSSREERDRQEWNRRFPDKKMSAKEWSER